MEVVMSTLSVPRPVKKRSLFVTSVAPTRSNIDRCGAILIVLVLVCWAAGFAIGFESAVAALTAIGFATAVFGFRWPAVGLMGVGILCTLDSVTRVYMADAGGLLRWNTFNYWLLAATLLNFSRILQISGPHMLLLKLLVLLLGVEIPISPDRTEGIVNELDILALFGLVIYFVRALRNPRSLLWLCMGFRFTPPP